MKRKSVLKRLQHMAIGIAILVLAIVGLLAMQVDDWSRDLTTNQARTRSEATDPLLRPLNVAASPDEIESAVVGFANRRSNWQFVSKYREADRHVIDLERTTRWLRFTDDVRVTITPDGERFEVGIGSQSRVGRGDLGQNPRNIRELNGELQKRLTTTEGEGGLSD